jgi:hypothetical protein
LTIRDDLLSQKAVIERKLAVIDRAGEDTYPVGTVALFSASVQKGYYLKSAEETWRDMAGTGPTRQLIQIILEWETTPSVGYFEIYKLLPGASPVYVSLAT